VTTTGTAAAEGLDAGTPLLAVADTYAEAFPQMTPAQATEAA
jgi:hypothetical protein